LQLVKNPQPGFHFWSSLIPTETAAGLLTDALTEKRNRNRDWHQWEFLPLEIVGDGDLEPLGFWA
jgi:hypothetical protein